MNRFDPFPLPSHGPGSQPIKWNEIARKIVVDSLRLQPHERVIISADPYFGGATLEAFREEIQRAEAIELATILHWTPAVAALRAKDGCKKNDDNARMEDVAMRDLFNVADVFVWLINDRRHGYATHAVGQSEWVLADWPGRSIHFHWFHDPRSIDPGAPHNLALNLQYQAAILDLDQMALSKRMKSLRDRLSSQTVRVTSPSGTDITFRMTSRFYLNDGDASRGKALTAKNARDREEEFPCGALRTVPDIDSVEGVIAFDGDPGMPSPGYGLDVNKWFAKGLRFVFRRGRVVSVETDGDQKQLDAEWARDDGDKDRLGEFVLGCNPLLKPVEGSTFQPYFGFGDGVIRLAVGENLESGGSNVSSFHRWLMVIGGDVEVNGKFLVHGGRVVDEF